MPVIKRSLHPRCSVAKSHWTLCKTMDCSIPGFPVLHCHLPEFAQTHVKSVMPSIFSSVALCSSCPQFSAASGSFPTSQLFVSGSQSIRASASASVLQGLFPLGWTGYISLQSKGLSRVFSSTAFQKHSVFLMVQLSWPYMTTVKTIVLTRWIFVSKVISLPFNMLPRWVIVFLPKSKHLFILWL